MHKKKPEKRVENEVINKQKLSLELSEEKGPNGDSFVGILTEFPPRKQPYLYETNNILPRLLCTSCCAISSLSSFHARGSW